MGQTQATQNAQHPRPITVEVSFPSRWRLQRIRSKRHSHGGRRWFHGGRRHPGKERWMSSRPGVVANTRGRITMQGPITDGWQECGTQSVFVYNNCGIGHTDKIAAIDFCGTLVRFGGAAIKGSGAFLPAGPNDWDFTSKDIPAKLQGLHKRGYKIVILVPMVRDARLLAAAGDLADPSEARRVPPVTQPRWTGPRASSRRLWTRRWRSFPAASGRRGVQRRPLGRCCPGRPSCPSGRRVRKVRGDLSLPPHPPPSHDPLASRSVGHHGQRVQRQHQA